MICDKIKNGKLTTMIYGILMLKIAQLTVQSMRICSNRFWVRVRVRVKVRIWVRVRVRVRLLPNNLKTNNPNPNPESVRAYSH